MKRSNDHVKIGLAFIFAAIVLAIAVYFGVSLANSISEDGTEPLSEPEIGVNIFTNVDYKTRGYRGCDTRSDMCQWTRILNTKLIDSRHGGKLYRIEVQVGQDSNGKVEWFKFPTSFAVLCAKNFPAILEQLDVAIKGNPWAVRAIDLYKPSDETDAALYTETCHGTPDAWRESGFAKVHGYSSVSAEYESGSVEFGKPEDVFELFAKPSAKIDPAASQKWLVGSWRGSTGEDVNSDQIPYCETDSIVTFYPDGKFRDGGGYGRYKLKFDQLTYYNVVSYDLAAPEGQQEDFSEFNKQTTVLIVRLGSNQLREDGDDMMRCISPE